MMLKASAWTRACIVSIKPLSAQMKIVLTQEFIIWKGQFVATAWLLHKYSLYQMPVMPLFYCMSPCKQLQKQLGTNVTEHNVSGGKGYFGWKRDCSHTPLFTTAPSLRGLANHMRRLQAVNKVEPIGWKLPLSFSACFVSAGLGYLACAADYGVEG